MTLMDLDKMIKDLEEKRDAAIPSMGTYVGTGLLACTGAIHVGDESVYVTLDAILDVLKRQREGAAS